MTREELIKIIYDSCSTAACPEPMNCKKLNDTDSCWNCTERVLADYENEIRKEAYEKLLAEVDHYENTIKFLISMVEEKDGSNDNNGES